MTLCRSVLLLAGLAALVPAPAQGHGPPHAESTHTFVPPETRRAGRWLSVQVVDDAGGEPLAARLHLELEGDAVAPTGLSSEGLRLEVRHIKRKQQFTAHYSRGTGSATVVPLPAETRGGVLTVTRGHSWRPERIPFEASRRETRLTVRLRRWVDPAANGWFAADVHLHFSRPDAQHDEDWLAVLDADGVLHGHFLTLKGGNLAGPWARQYAFGAAGQAVGAQGHWIRSGSERRDPMQGHALLLGATEAIEPVSTGGLGAPAVEENFPPLHDSMKRARRLGGLAGVAHGNALGRAPTGLLDAVLGAADFFEIANTHRTELDDWYLLLNAGIVLPPVGGTDLPNHPFRDPWQPLLGETRTWVKAATAPDFDAWKMAVKRGATIVSSGPWIELEVDGAGPGQVVRLPAEGGTVRVVTRLRSPRKLESLHVVHDGDVIRAPPQRTREEGIYHWSVAHQVDVTRSGWIAARGRGVEKRALRHEAGIRQRVMAHTAAVRVLVGDEPIGQEASIERLRKRLQSLRATYVKEGTYAQVQDRSRALALFDQALQILAERLARPGDGAN